MKLGLFLKNLGHPIAYYPSLVKVVGGVLPCLFLCQMYYWQGKQKDPDGWIFKSQAEIQEETGMGRREQESARKDLKARGLIEERFAGCPRRLEYLLIDDALEARWQECLQGVPTAIADVPPAWKRGKSSDKSKTAQSILAKNANMDSQKTELHIGAIEHYVQADRANISLYTKTTPENTNKDYSSPLTPQGAKEKKEEGSAALLEEEKPLATTEGGQPEPSRFVGQPKQDLAQEPKILPETKVPLRQTEVVPATTALIEPFGNQRSGLAIARERANGFPDGEWIIDGEMDKNFLHWVAIKYTKNYGYDIHEAKRNVRRSWKNDPERLIDDWTWYTEEMGHHAANIAVQERAGISGAAVSEHKRFVEKHQRALTNPSPHASHEAAQELMDLASREFDPTTHHPLDGTESPVVLPAEPDWDAIADRDSQAEQDYLSSDAYTPQQATTDVPRDEYGQTENGDAYKAYKPAQVESVPPPKDFLKRLNDLAEAREMKPVTERVGRRNVRAPQKSPLELLNDMLAEPILRRDRSVQIRAESYSSLSIEQEYELYRDENGLIYKVEEIQF